MAKRGDPNVLRLVVIMLRSKTGMTQAQFGKAARVDQAKVSHYEAGKVAPPERVLRRMAEAAGIDWPLVAHLHKFLSTLLEAAARRTTSSTARVPGLKSLEPVRLAVAPYLTELETVEAARRPAESRQEAEQIWAALERHPVPFRRRLIELSPRSGSRHLAVLACEASLRKAAHHAGEALELAELALAIAERAPGEESWRARLKGYCWAHIANARRVGNDLAGADEAFTRAWSLWRAGTDSEPALLAEWQLFSLEASLRRDQLRFPVALKLLDQARAASGGHPAANARLLLIKGNILEQMGDSERALAALREAASFVEGSADPRLVFGFHFDTANNLCCLERYGEAAQFLPQVRELAIQQNNDLDLLRVTWLEARVAAGQGNDDEAIAGLEQVRRDFMSRGLAYDAALASLDHAVLLLKAGRMAEVRELAMAMGWIFEAKGIHRETLAALKLFCEAARREVATVEMAHEVLNQIKNARQNVHPMSLG